MYTWPKEFTDCVSLFFFKTKPHKIERWLSNFPSKKPSPHPRWKFKQNPPLPQVMQLSFPLLGKLQRSALLEWKEPHQENTTFLMMVSPLQDKYQRKYWVKRVLILQVGENEGKRTKLTLLLPIWVLPQPYY